MFEILLYEGGSNSVVAIKELGKWCCQDYRQIAFPDMYRE
jgi:hypothetical protein